MKIGLLFDLDGTIIESEEIKATCHCNAVKHYRGVIDKQFYENCIGNSFKYVALSFLKEAHLNVPFEDYKSLFNKFYQEEIKTITQPIDGFYDFLKSLDRGKVKVGLVTSSERWMVTEILTNLNIIDSFDIIVAKNDVKHEKPSPEPYLKAKQGLDVGKSFVFEDTTAGFLSARGITEFVYGIKHKYNLKQDFTLVKDTYTDYWQIPGTLIE